MSKKVLILLPLLTFFFACSSPAADLEPPQFQDLKILDQKTIELSFDKVAIITSVEVEENDHTPSIDGYIVSFDKPFVPGQFYQIIVEAVAESGNSVKFKADFYGHNPKPASVIFNEFTTRHSASHRERIELYVLESGNLTGITLYIGQPDKNQTRFVILPSFPVEEGDLITLLLRPLGSESTNVYDIFLELDPPGLPNARGILILMDNPSAHTKIMDVLVYVDGTAIPPATFLVQLDWLQQQGAWIGDPIQICGTSPTRSVLRRGRNYTKSKDDWYVVVTGGANFSQDRRPGAFKQTCIP